MSTPRNLRGVLFLLFRGSREIGKHLDKSQTMEEKEEKEEYIIQLNDDIDRLEYLVEAPLDDAYKIRVAREKLGMCFPDEIVFYTEID